MESAHYASQRAQAVERSVCKQRGLADQVGGGARAQLLHDVGAMGLNGAHADLKLLGNLAVHASFRNQLQNFPFARAEGLESFAAFFIVSVPGEGAGRPRKHGFAGQPAAHGIEDRIRVRRLQSVAVGAGVDRVLMAVGRVPNSAGLGLADLGIDTDESGRIVVDAKGRTTLERVWAVGDVSTDLLSPGSDAHSRSDRELHGQCIFEHDKDAQAVLTKLKADHPDKRVMLVAEKGTMGVGSSRMSGVNNVALWTGKQASPYVPFINIAPIVGGTNGISPIFLPSAA